MSQWLRRVTSAATVSRVSAGRSSFPGVPVAGRPDSSNQPKWYPGHVPDRCGQPVDGGPQARHDQVLDPREELADRRRAENLAVVYPPGVNKRGCSSWVSWNCGVCCGYQD